jgi:hypothetical protein
MPNLHAMPNPHPIAHKPIATNPLDNGDRNWKFGAIGEALGAIAIGNLGAIARH